MASAASRPLKRRTSFGLDLLGPAEPPAACFWYRIPVTLGPCGVEVSSVELVSLGLGEDVEGRAATDHLVGWAPVAGAGQRESRCVGARHLSFAQGAGIVELSGDLRRATFFQINCAQQWPCPMPCSQVGQRVRARPRSCSTSAWR